MKLERELVFALKPALAKERASSRQRTAWPMGSRASASAYGGTLEARSQTGSA